MPFLSSSAAARRTSSRGTLELDAGRTSSGSGEAIAACGAGTGRHRRDDLEGPARAFLRRAELEVTSRTSKRSLWYGGRRERRDGAVRLHSDLDSTSCVL